MSAWLIYDSEQHIRESLISLRYGGLHITCVSLICLRYGVQWFTCGSLISLRYGVLGVFNVESTELHESTDRVE